MDVSRMTVVSTRWHCPGGGWWGLAGVCTTLAIFYFSGNLRSMVCALLVLVGVIVGTVISASLLLRSDRYR
jgi:uncharacterized membrane protein YedE/YeeE